MNPLKSKEGNPNQTIINHLKKEKTKKEIQKGKGRNIHQKIKRNNI